MKALIVEDDFTSRILMQGLLKSYGTSYAVENGREAVEAVRVALDENDPYDLVCLDIMMPEMDGQEALRRIRELEKARGGKRAKIIMTTSLADRDNVIRAAQGECDHFLIKPVEKAKLSEILQSLGLVT